MSRRTSRRGSALIEFGLWTPIIAMMLSGIVDFSWYMAQSEIVMRAAREGTRVASASSPATMSTLGNAAIDGVLAGRISACTRSVNTTANYNGQLQLITSTVTCPFNPLLGIVVSPSDLEYSFTMLAENQAST